MTSTCVSWDTKSLEHCQKFQGLGPAFIQLVFFFPSLERFLVWHFSLSFVLWKMSQFWCPSVVKCNLESKSSTDIHHSPKHSILACMYAKSLQSSLILYNPMGCKASSSVHGILQARILEWVAISFSRGSSQTGGGTWISCTTGGLLHGRQITELPWKPPKAHW